MKKNKTIIVNSITISRVLSIIPIFFIESINYVFFAALWVSLSDFIDGFLARKWDVATTFGAKLDQHSDKLASLSLLFYFFKQNQLSFSFVSLINSSSVFDTPFVDSVTNTIGMCLILSFL